MTPEGPPPPPRNAAAAYLEPLVLQDPLDGGVLARRGQLGLEDDAEGPVSDHLALRVLEVPGLARDAVLDLLANHLCQRER